MKVTIGTIHMIGRLLALIRPIEKRYLLGLAGRVLLSTVERTTIGLLLKNTVDQMMVGTQQSFVASLLYWVIFYAAYMVVSPFILYYWRAGVVYSTANIREVVFRHLNRLPLGYHEIHHTGDSLSVLTNDVTAVERAYQDDLMILMEATLQGLSAAVIMLILNWQLALLVILSGVAPLIVNVLFSGPLRNIGTQVQDRLGVVSERMADLLVGYQVIRSFNLGEWIIERFEQANNQVFDASIRRVRVEARLAFANDTAGLFNFAAMASGCYFALQGWTTFGVMFALIQLSIPVQYFVYSIGGTISRVQSALAAADRILAVMDIPLEPIVYEAPPKSVPENRSMMPTNLSSAPLIAFDNVLFGYGEGENILNGLTFEAKRGQMVAFAGPSGGGKSTIFKLLLGCYPIRKGEVRLSGVDITRHHLTYLREFFAYVPQDAYLFAGTITDNIRYGKPGASTEQITAAAQAAFAHDFIAALPQGYQTMVGERGARLSGGQRQRIAIARALLKDAPILLLDEATSALDSESEQEVQQALEVLMRGRTTLTIAHRLSTILNADTIYVIENGCVVERGTHAQLLANAGVYRNLFDLQFKKAQETPVAN